MKPVEELINTSELGWSLVKGWIDSAKNTIQIFPSDSGRAKTALYQTQVTTRSPMGAIIYRAAGMLIDHGWIRILGSGDSMSFRSLPEWNSGKSFKQYGERPDFLLVADDVIGGFFAINGGSLGSDPGKVYYLSPDNLDWEPLDLTYTEFLLFCFNGDLNKFYGDYRWKGWERDVMSVKASQVYNFFPPLWTKEGKNIGKAFKKVISIEEQYQLIMEMMRQLGKKKNGG